MDGDPDSPPEESVTVVLSSDEETTIVVAAGRNLRRILLEHGFDVYGSVSRVTNCGGRGLCGTCGVRLEGGPEPTHWHDRAAERWGYPRLSCRVTSTRTCGSNWWRKSSGDSSDPGGSRIAFPASGNENAVISVRVAHTRW